MHKEMNTEFENLSNRNLAFDKVALAAGKAVSMAEKAGIDLAGKNFVDRAGQKIVVHIRSRMMQDLCSLIQYSFDYIS